ncbi:MAG: nucleoside-diphosphate sugar epimerase/dehydratase [Spirochaetales bacterium]|nr:nucleoside-diphosphate sugar epimerase/dehydratase [Spirochaetales bacterium]
MAKKTKIRTSLAFYDILIFAIVAFCLYWWYKGSGILSVTGAIYQSVIAFIFIFGARIIGNVYRQIWRYGGIQCYIRLLLCDAIGSFLYLIVERILPFERVPFIQLVAFCSMNCLGTLSLRMFYRYAYKFGSEDSLKGKLLRKALRIVTGSRVNTEPLDESQKIKIAIIGAGTVGISLADELLNNKHALYYPRCFIDVNKDKIGREIRGLSVFSEDEATLENLRQHQIQEVVFAVQSIDNKRRYELYDYYQKAGFGIKIYDYPAMDSPSKKRQLRSFSVEDLLFRKQKTVVDERTASYYSGKVILITGGGGSIGSELCRQVAKMNPKKLIIVDIYENCAYDIQQELKIAYAGKLDLSVEIVSITNKKGLGRVFATYHPDIVINAAAHKHVPLMEHNCIEAVENNIYGCLNVIELCEEYGASRFMMVSTDKAVNPTNVMGATKRMCEMIMQAYSTRGKVKCSATRFGNVLGSAGSVIPLFKRQIAAGGPVTITDKRIIRYFMTIPEASQLVLESGAMANNGEIFVLDMGKPVKILDLATNMINLSGVQGIEIVETGLRPGEKLYEELLVKKDELEKTDNDLIFVEKENPISMEELEDKLKVLYEATTNLDDEGVREALRKAVPTFVRPEDVNKNI